MGARPPHDEIKGDFVSDNELIGNNPDNITVSPRGGILLCEDGESSVDAFGSGMRLLRINAQGDSFVLCKNNVDLSARQVASAGKSVAPGNYRGSEFAGACSDHSGRLFF